MKLINLTLYLLIFAFSNGIKSLEGPIIDKLTLIEESFKVIHHKIDTIEKARLKNLFETCQREADNVAYFYNRISELQKNSYLKKEYLKLSDDGRNMLVNIIY